MLSKSHRVHSVQFLYGHKNTVNHYLRTLQSAAVTGWEKKRQGKKRRTPDSSNVLVHRRENKCFF